MERSREDLLRRCERIALALALVVAVSACGGTGDDASPDADSASTVDTSIAPADAPGPAATTPAPAPTETTPADRGTAIGPDLVSAAIAGLATIGPDMSGSATCPLGDPVAIAASLGSTTSYDDIDNDFRNSGYRCVARVDGSEPFLAVSVEAHVDIADLLATYPDEITASRPFEAGTIVSTCPWDTPETSDNCKAIWIDDQRTLAIGFSQSAGDATSAFAAAGAQAAVPLVLGNLAARSSGASAAPTVPAISVPSCGVTLAAASVARFCGVTGTWQSTTGWSFGDGASAKVVTLASNTAGVERFVGPLDVDGVTVAYFLATGTREQPTIVDLIDKPAGSFDYRADEFVPEFRILDDAGNTLVTYTIVDISFALS